MQQTWSWPIWPPNQKGSGWPEENISINFSHLRCLRKIFISFQFTILEFVLDIPSCLLFSQVKNISSLFSGFRFTRSKSCHTIFSHLIWYLRLYSVKPPLSVSPQCTSPSSIYRGADRDPVRARGVCWRSQSFRGREEVDRTCEEDCWDSCGSMRKNATRNGSSAASLPPHACSGEVPVTGRTPLHLWRTWKDLLMLTVEL